LQQLFLTKTQIQMGNQQIAVFEQSKIRQTEHNGEIYFSIVDIIETLTDSPNPRNYWSMLKKQDNQLYTIPVQLKLQSKDGKFYKTDCANTEGVFRIIQSVPSPKAEPFKLWLASLGKQAIEETENPELGFDRLRELYKTKGYTDEWIHYRIKGLEIRKELTIEWQNRGITEGVEYAHLTATIAKSTFGVTPTEHSQLKGLEKQNLRDHMTNMELLFTAIGEEATRAIAVRDDAQGFHENQDAAQKGGETAGKALKIFEDNTGTKVLSTQNYMGTIDKNTLNLSETTKNTEGGKIE
jgi:DNA-damage-inducible protein D